MSGQSITLRFALVAGLALALLIPLLFVVGLVDERQRYHAEVVAEIAQSWGGTQAVVGPLLIVPEIYTHTDPQKDHLIGREERRLRVVLPDDLTVDIRLNHEFRSRAIYEVPVYEASLAVSGTFDLEGLKRTARSSRLLWSEARLVVGISDPQAISKLSELRFGEQRTPFSGSTRLGWIPEGVHANVAIDDSTPQHAFEFKGQIKGTETLSFAQLGRETQVEVESTWPHPKFTGAHLPTHREIEASGFSARWQIHELARSLPSHWIEGEVTSVHEASANIELFQPSTPYTLVDRGIKYAVLFIALTFLSLLCFELRMPVRLHIVQFGVVGLALVLFYLTLLSLSEHVAFGLAYFAATLLLTSMIGCYTWSATRVLVGHAPGIAISALLLSLYACLYVLLRLEAFALLVGTIVLLIGLAALMYATRDLVIEVSDRVDEVP